MPERYEIVVSCSPSPLLDAALDGFEAEVEGPGRLRLVGSVADQAALHGALHRLQDLHVGILEIRRLDAR